MVSFSCEKCGDVLTKGKLDKHRGHCYGASFTCLDCMVHFPGTSYKTHTSCMSEAQKYQGAMYKGEKKGKQQQQQSNKSGAMIPRKAYVEDEQDERSVTTLKASTKAVPPKAPSPPPHNALPAGASVYDYLVKDDNPQAVQRAPVLETQASHNTDDSHFQKHGYSYGDAPIEGRGHHFDSFSTAHTQSTQEDSQNYYTPGKLPRNGETRSERKRKRAQLEELDIPKERPLIHTGLSTGLDRMLSRPANELEKSSPYSPTKRSKQHRRGSSSSADTRGQSTTVNGPSSSKAGNAGQLVQYRNPAELFLSFVTKGPDSQRGMSINKALKRYHRERASSSAHDKESSDKEIWKDLRVRKNERGEIVLFV